MAVASVIVEFENGTGEAVLNSLARINNVSVYGVKDNQIVTVIESDDIKSVEDTIKALYAVDKVIGVYPVFAGDYE
ncbi:MAG: chaperone NapD [Thermodesulfovibrionales bacterium]|nr:chaperone NapD [Thermodesulfovibrionales bacterium]